MRAWLPLTLALAWAAVVFWASVLLRPATIPRPVDGLLAVAGPLGAHFGMYALLSALLLLTAAGLGWFPRRQFIPVVAVVVVAAAYGASMEVFQSLVPERHMSYLDMAVNTLGALVGAGAGAFALGVLWRWQAGGAGGKSARRRRRRRTGASFPGGSSDG